MSMSDDCYELQTLRWLRDRILKKTKCGEMAICQYYDEAPEIVKAINMDSGAAEIWDRTYKEIAIAVKLTLAGDYGGAFEHYRQVSERLKSDFI
jgi:hypothetical protein